MENLALKLPGSDKEFTPIVSGGAIQDPSLWGVLSPIINIALLVASVLMFVWMFWGVFQYIYAGGNKENLAKARSRITWAIVGFVIVILAFTIEQYAKEIFPPQEVEIIKVE